MKTILMFIVLAALCHCLGCLSLPIHYHGDISAMNRSDANIRFVIIDSAGGRNRFGFVGSHGAGATRSDCVVDNLRSVTISWSENGDAKTAVLDLSSYSKSVSDVVDMIFSYEGNGKWTVESKRSSGRPSPGQ